MMMMMLLWSWILNKMRKYTLGVANSRGFLVNGQKDDRVEISLREREGWFCTFLHCVFLHFCRDRSLGIVQRMERRNTQGGKQWPGKRGRQGWRLLEGGKSRFCSFPRRKSWDRAPSTGCTCLLSTTKQNCGKKQSTAMLLQYAELYVRKADPKIAFSLFWTSH